MSTEESLFENYHLAKPIDESRWEEPIYSHFEYRSFSQNKLKVYSDTHLIYSENEHKITLITKEKSDWTTNLDVDVNDYQIIIYYKSKEALRNAVLKVWNNHITEATEERDSALNRFDNYFK